MHTQLCRIWEFCQEPSSFLITDGWNGAGWHEWNSMNGIEWLPVGLGKLSISNIRPPATSRLRQRIENRYSHIYRTIFCLFSSGRIPVVSSQLKLELIFSLNYWQCELSPHLYHPIPKIRSQKIHLRICPTIQKIPSHTKHPLRGTAHGVVSYHTCRYFHRYPTNRSDIALIPREECCISMETRSGRLDLHHPRQLL